MNLIRFYKEENRWYADIPNWDGSKAELEMIEGADTMLDFIAKDKLWIKLKISDTKFDGSTEIKFIKLATEYDNGAFYKLESYKGSILDLDVFLCDVTKFVFGEFPTSIFISE